MNVEAVKSLYSLAMGFALFVCVLVLIIAATPLNRLLAEWADKIAGPMPDAMQAQMLREVRMLNAHRQYARSVQRQIACYVRNSNGLIDAMYFDKPSDAQAELDRINRLWANGGAGGGYGSGDCQFIYGRKIK